MIAGAADLPVSADLQHGFGDAPEICAETIRLTAGAGLVGGSIEDATGRAEEPIYPFDLRGPGKGRCYRSPGATPVHARRGPRISQQPARSDDTIGGGRSPKLAPTCCTPRSAH
jgi:hypothetical protein